MIPRRHWSGHQYGAGGTLCLEWREDNWQSGVTGADLLRSAYKLLSTERHPVQPGRVPSAHRLTEGQELRSSGTYRLVLTSGALSSFAALPIPGSLRLQTAMVFHTGPSVTFVSQVEGVGGSMVATPDLPAGLTSYAPLFAVTHDGHALKHGSFDTSKAITSPAELDDTLRRRWIFAGGVAGGLQERTFGIPAPSGSADGCTNDQSVRSFRRGAAGSAQVRPGHAARDCTAVAC